MSRRKDGSCTTDEPNNAEAAQATKHEFVVDSWEDEADTVEQQATVTKPTNNIQGTRAVDQSGYTSNYQLAEPGPAPRTPIDDARRPEKSTAVASRLIAAGLGVKVQRTADQRQYDMAARKLAREQKEKEIQARKQREVDLAAASRAMWED